MEYQQYTLNNGIKVIHSQAEGLAAHCGLFINVGSRDEYDDERGLAHYIEHVVFKGTKKRRAYHILSRLDDVGGELNAYTTKEETCIHATFLADDFHRTLELIYDIAFNSVFPIKELEKEKEVIIDEINSYKDSPSELIYDEFEELIYPNDPMGYSILGTPEHLQSFTREHILNFINRNYHTDQMVFCIVGDIPFKRAKYLCEKYFGTVATSNSSQTRQSVVAYSPKIRTIDKNTHQSHVVMGDVAYDYHDNRRLGLHLLNNLLGGPGMNSKLNMALRERNGIAYNIESAYNPYQNTGVFSIYFGADTEQTDRAITLINKELKKLCHASLTSIQLYKATRQFKGQLVLSTENGESRMLSMGKSLLVYNKVDSIKEVCKKIDSITSKELQDIANEILNPERMSTLIYK